MDRVQQCVRKIAAKYGADLDHLAGWPEPIQPRHQRIMQGDRDRASREVGVATLQHRPRQFLYKQRHAVGALDHRGDGFIR
jgi:hypothetical protein